MIDSHCHLDFDIFDSDLHQIIEDAKAAGVSRFLIPGTTPDGWQRQLTLKQKYPYIDIALGLHPYFPDTLIDRHIDTLEAVLADNQQQVVALGEIGLDSTVEIAMAQQERMLCAQLELAQTLHLPVILHHRKTHHLLLKHINALNFKEGGVIHAFSGSEQVARDYIDRGFYLGIGGTITYSRASKTREAVASLPLSSLLLETDAPDMPLCGYQGERNTPAKVSLVAQTLAQLHDTSIDHISEITDGNYRRLFCSEGNEGERPSA
ncbi:TatD family hydrolase [Salinimonas sp. HHU 13199]|uniref:TatD family hydrolase n=1 Tax=Salinimonas profundi TaxID=2729140 RepID=A0ABR8LQG5_9ALTE|nr:TatD family hydrolase [Salinimonas profundi]MBD3587316.1 TatD family hydrolase [Salinimonas profundi]